jgi:S1-C subfamily serine protease
METVLSNLSEALADAVAAAGAGVVRVEARRRFHASGLIWNTDGIIVTNHHVVQRSENIRIGLSDGRTVPATLIGRDPTTDIAVLKIAETDIAAPSFGDSDGIRVGNMVLALARPGNNIRATLGIISARGSGEWRTPAGGTLDYFVQSDVTLFPGFSGGPIVSAGGDTLGITSSGLVRGIGVVLPLLSLRRIVGAILTHGRIPRGYLGVGTYAVMLPSDAAGRLNQEEGLLLVTVETDSPADRSGLMVGDIIVSLAGHSVEDIEGLQGALNGDSIGTSAPVRIIRGGQILELSVAIGERE